MKLFPANNLLLVKTCLRLLQRNIFFLPKRLQNVFVRRLFENVLKKTP